MEKKSIDEIKRKYNSYKNSVCSHLMELHIYIWWTWTSTLISIFINIFGVDRGFTSLFACLLGGNDGSVVSQKICYVRHIDWLIDYIYIICVVCAIHVYVSQKKQQQNISMRCGAIRFRMSFQEIENLMGNITGVFFTKKSIKIHVYMYACIYTSVVLWNALQNDINPWSMFSDYVEWKEIQLGLAQY